MDITGHAAVITGGGSGLGAETARHLAKAGAKVTVVDLNEAGVAAVAAETGGLGLICDVGDGPQAEAVMAKAQDAHGKCRILVNCAGIAPGKRIVSRSGPMPLEDFEHAVRVNLIGTFNFMRLAAAEMMTLDPLEDDERGIMINTTSIAYAEGQLGQAGYAASKAGVVGLMMPAVREFTKTGIRVMTIAPGLIATPLLLNMPQEAQDNLASQVPFPRRFGKPDEYARLVMHIIDNTMLNGETIRLDGAMRMR